MLNKLKKMAEKVTLHAEPAMDPSHFNDPFASQVEWGPAKGGGSNFKTHKFVSDGFNRAEFKIATGAKLFCFIFILFGILAPVIFLLIDSDSGSAVNTPGELAMLTVFSLIFTGAGVLLYYKFAKPVVFDKMKGAYWKGWKKPGHIIDKPAIKEYARLQDIHALQIIKEFVRSDKNSYYSYELNLVLRDGTRLNVVDHGKIGALRNDAVTLARFLGKPLWDAA